MSLTKEQLADYSGPQLVEIYNKMNPKYPVEKFSSRQAGIDRILKFQAATKTTASLPEKTKPKEKAPKPVSTEPKVRQPKKGVIWHLKEMCKRPHGASLAEIGKELKTIFPDREEDSMIVTAKVNLNPKLNPDFDVIKEESEERGTIFKLVAKK